MSSVKLSEQILDIPYTLLNDRPASDADDCLDTSETARELAKILLASRGNAPFVLAVDGEWGVGKTTLLQQIRAQLVADSQNSGHSNENDARTLHRRWLSGKQDNPHVKCVQFNAWTADNSNVLENLISTVLYELDPNFLRRQAHRLARRRGLLSALRVSFSIAAGFFGLSRAVNDVLASLSVSARSRTEARETIRGILDDWLNDDSRIENKGKRSLVILVDDLDRCSSNTIIQMCEVIKLYLDMPGLIFVLACSLSVIGQGVAAPEGGRRGEEFTYLEKIVQVAYRVPQPDDAQIHRLIKRCAEQSHTDSLIDTEVSKILAEGAYRNPRRIKRIINSFILEYKLHPSWSQQSLGIASLIKVVLLYQLYPYFYEVLVSPNSSDDLISIFLDYAKIKNSSMDNSEWRGFAERHDIPAEKRDEVLARLKKELPMPLPELIEDEPLISLLNSLGDMNTCRVIRQQLINNPFRSERGLNAVILGLQAGTLVAKPVPQSGDELTLNALVDGLRQQVLASEGTAATEEAQYRELQLEADANNAAASSVAQAAQRKMQINSAIFQGFDKIIA